MRSFQRLKTFILKEVANHPISKDIRSKQKSPFLIGQDHFESESTLFNFMGFDQGTDPVGELLEFLEESISYELVPTVEAGVLKKGLMLNLILPSEADLRNAGLIIPRYGDGRSWPELIEDGIDNLPNFLNEYRAASVSGFGIQIKAELHPTAVFVPQDYLTGIFARVADRITQYKINASIV